MNTFTAVRGKPESGNWNLLATGQSNEFPLENWQGFYDLAFEVSPDDADIMFAGTSSLYKSTNRGADFSLVGGYGGDFPIHPDVQCMILMEQQQSLVIYRRWLFLLFRQLHQYHQCLF